MTFGKAQPDWVIRNRKNQIVGLIEAKQTDRPRFDPAIRFAIFIPHSRPIEVWDLDYFQSVDAADYEKNVTLGEYDGRALLTFEDASELRQLAAHARQPGVAACAADILRRIGQ